VTGKQRVSGPVLVVVIVAALVVAYAVFWRAELAPPGVDILHEHGDEEEVGDLPWSPPVRPEETQAIAVGLMPMGISAVFPPPQEDRGQGVRVAMVALGSPGARAGLRPGDLIKQLHEWELGSPFGLIGALEQVEPDKEYEMVVVRGSEELRLTVTGLVPLPLEERAG